MVPYAVVGSRESDHPAASLWEGIQGVWNGVPRHGAWHITTVLWLRLVLCVQGFEWASVSVGDVRQRCQTRTRGSNDDRQNALPAGVPQSWRYSYRPELHGGTCSMSPAKPCSTQWQTCCCTYSYFIHLCHFNPTHVCNLSVPPLCNNLPRETNWNGGHCVQSQQEPTIWHKKLTVSIHLSCLF